MKVVSVINYKGGVGKTTLTSNLASELAGSGYKVLCIDLDPQTNLTFSFIPVETWIELYKDTKTIKFWYDAFIDRDTIVELSDLIITPPKVNLLTEANLDLISSHLGLINVDLEMAVMLGGASQRQQRHNHLKVYSLLRNAIDNLKGTTYSYDYVLIDCPPNFNIVTKSALVASDYYLIPARPDYLSTLGIDELQNRVSGLVKEYNNFVSQEEDDYMTISPTLLGVIFNMVTFKNGQVISAQRHYIDQVLRNQTPCFDIQLRDNKSIYSSAPEYCIPVVKQSLSGATYSQVIAELKAVTTEFLERTDV